MKITGNQEDIKILETENMKLWPVLKRYSGKQLRRIALPLGGIGTGTVSLGGRGNLQDWAIMNTPAFGYTPVMTKGMRHTGPFFALYTETKGQKKTILLEGPLDTENYEASEGSTIPNHGMPRFRECEFATAYPLGQVVLKDDDVPLDVTLKAFNPLIPGDSDRSGIPVAILTYTLKNNTDSHVDASVCGTMVNCIGADGSRTEQHGENEFVYAGSKGNRNEYRRGDILSGIHMTSDKVSRRSAAWGTMSITTSSEGRISHRTA